ncbi:hypothetical protein [Rhodoplanes azumiensis]|uniref:Uncharacterized protein n=1 Tax=Rhodoplanes azumiensis TaxID=1897628 RepID=A0ABW5AG93_9BRAD
MVDVAYGARVRPARRRHSRRAMVAMAGLVVVGGVAVAAGMWSVWARWPATPAPIATDAPHLPIVVAEETFAVAPGAIRMAVQRRPGPQERLDLVYAWPELTPPRPLDPVATGAIAGERGASDRHSSDRLPGERLPGERAASDRIYVTVAPAAGALQPAERLRVLWLRYVRDTLEPAPDGLAIVEFRDGTPYQGEDLAWEENAPERFLARCERPAPGRPTATCLTETIVGGAVVTMRFPREWLADWRKVADGFNRLLVTIRPKAG